MDKQIITEEGYLALNGASILNLGDSALHKNKGRNSDKTWSKMVAAQSKKDRELIERRDALRVEYAKKVESGEVRPPTRVERLISTANGHEDLDSVHAARRLLTKRGVDWKTNK